MKYMDDIHTHLRDLQYKVAMPVYQQALQNFIIISLLSNLMTFNNGKQTWLRSMRLPSLFTNQALVLWQ